MAMNGCRSTETALPYPHESVLTVVAELKLFLERDPYLWPPGQDLEGRNIYRITLSRLDNLGESIDPVYEDVLAFASAEAYERLGEYQLAAEKFALAARRGSGLSERAQEREQFCLKLARLIDRSGFASSLEGYLTDMSVARRRLREWGENDLPYPYPSLVRLERERLLGDEARLWFQYRALLPGALDAALRAVETLLTEHAESWHVMEHQLLMGGFWEQLARDLTQATPAEGIHFDPELSWEQYVERARAAYREVAEADGNPAKPEGQARLRALDAYALRIRNASR